MGTFRLLLAATVIMSHVPGGYYLIFDSLTAVRIFFMISGFYMSLIYTTKYSRLEEGKFLFYSNRILRLYPTYIAILILYTVFDKTLFGLSNNLFLKEEYWAFPDFFVLLSNVFILGLDALICFSSSINPIYPVIPPTWTIGIELIFYLMVPFVVLNRPLLVGILIVGSIIIRIYFDVNGYEFKWSYNFFPSNLVFFLMGYLGCVVFNKIKNYEVSRYLGWGGVAFFVAYIAYKSFIYDDLFLAFIAPTVNSRYGIAVYSVVALLLIPFLFLVSKDSRIDRYIGNLSYSTYLIGYPVIDYTYKLGLLYPYLNNYALAVLIITISLAWIIYVTIERPIETFRQRRIEKNT